MAADDWRQLEPLASKKWTCGHCDRDVAQDRGYMQVEGKGKSTNTAYRFIYVCPSCEQPTYFGEGKQVPGAAFAKAVDHLPTHVDSLYSEARNCLTVCAPTASVLACRKLLMNVAVSQGADPGKTFLVYVDWLAGNGYVPPNGRGWLDHIRKKGNEATHEIPQTNMADARSLLAFTEGLLRIVFEFPGRVPKP